MWSTQRIVLRTFSELPRHPHSLLPCPITGMRYNNDFHPLLFEDITPVFPAESYLPENLLNEKRHYNL